jgi:hypothetical protein
MKSFLTVISFLLAAHVTQAQQAPIRNIYFPVDSFHLSTENVVFLEKQIHNLHPGEKMSIRVLIHDDAKNKVAINELDRKRALEIDDFFLAEGIPANNLKNIKTPGREAKGFISDDMKNLLVYDVEVLQANPAVQFTTTEPIPTDESANQTFVFAAGEEKKIVSKAGVEIGIPAGIFEYKTGHAVKGKIQVDLKEFFQGNQMAAAGIITMCNEIPLKLCGLINLKATVDGLEVRVKKGQSLTIRIPACADIKAPSVYTGLDLNGSLAFLPVDPAKTVLVENSKFVFQTGALHWIGCGELSKAERKGTLTLKLSDPTNTAVRLYLKEENELLAAYAQPETKEIGFTRLPLGKKAVLLCYSLKEGKVYTFSKEITLSVDGKEKVNLREGSLPGLMNLFSGLEK